MGWKGQSQRHRRARLLGKAGGRYATPKKRFKRPITAPLSNKSTHLPIQVGITIPSTEYDKRISTEEFRKRTETTAKEFSNRFGGDTAIKGKGDYTSKGKLIREDIIVIESSMTKEDYKKNKPRIEAYIKQKRKDWKQETIGYTFEDDFYIYPKFDSKPTKKTTKKKLKKKKDCETIIDKVDNMITIV